MSAPLPSATAKVPATLSGEIRHSCDRSSFTGEIGLGCSTRVNTTGTRPIENSTPATTKGAIGSVLGNSRKYWPTPSASSEMTW